MIPMANTQLGIEFEHVNMFKIQSVWKVSDAFAVILLNKDQFWFLLMLRTSSAEVRQKKVCRETQIAQPPENL